MILITPLYMDNNVNKLLVACYATLHPALLVVGPSVHWSIGPSVRPLLRRSVGLMVRRSVTLYFLGVLAVFNLIALAQMIK